MRSVWWGIRFDLRCVGVYSKDITTQTKGKIMSVTTVVPYTLYVSSSSGKSEIVQGILEFIEFDGDTNGA
jgi:hypothetical protein